MSGVSASGSVLGGGGAAAPVAASPGGGLLLRPLQTAAHAAATLNNSQPKVTTSRRIQEMVAAVAGSDERLDADVEELLLDIANDFVENVSTFACMLAKHRQSNTIEVQDLQRHLADSWQLRLPGFSLPDHAATAPPLGVGSHAPHSTLASATAMHVPNIRAPLYGVGEAHRKRVALIQKARAKEAKRAAAQAESQTGAEEDGQAGAGKPAAAAAASAQAKKRKRSSDE